MDIKKFTDLLKLTTPYADDVSTKSVKSDSEEEVEAPRKVKQQPQEKLLAWDVTVAPYKVPKRIVRSAMVFIILFVIFLILVRDWMFLFLILQPKKLNTKSTIMDLNTTECFLDGTNLIISFSMKIIQI